MRSPRAPAHIPPGPGLVSGGQREPGQAHRAAIASGFLLAELDRLNELGHGVPAQRREHRAVQRQRVVPLAFRREVEQPDRLRRERVDEARDPAGCAHQHAFGQQVGTPDENLQRRCLLLDLSDAADILRELLDAHHAADLGEPGQQRRSQVNAGREGVVVGDDGQANRRDLSEVRDHFVPGRGVRGRRQAHHTVGTEFGGTLRPPHRLARGLARHSGHELGSALGHLGSYGKDSRPLIVGHRLVLSERAAGDEAMHALADQPPAVLGKCVEVDLIILIERRRRRGEHARESRLGGGHRRVLLLVQAALRCPWAQA